MLYVSLVDCLKHKMQFFFGKEKQLLISKCKLKAMETCFPKLCQNCRLMQASIIQISVIIFVQCFSVILLLKKL